MEMSVIAVPSFTGKPGPAMRHGVISLPGFKAKPARYIETCGVDSTARRSRSETELESLWLKVW